MNRAPTVVVGARSLRASDGAGCEHFCQPVDADAVPTASVFDAVRLDVDDRSDQPLGAGAFDVELSVGPKVDRSRHLDFSNVNVAVATQAEEVHVAVCHRVTCLAALDERGDSASDALDQVRSELAGSRILDDPHCFIDVVREC